MVNINPLPLSLSINSADLANKIIGSGIKQFSQRFPQLNQGNLRHYMQRIMDYEPDWNVFCNALMNGPVMDIYVQNMWENPLAALKTGRVMSQGSWIREIGYPLIVGQDYDVNAVDVFSTVDPQVLTAYHVQNRKQKYKITINEEALRQALFDDPEGGLASFVNGLINSVYKSDNLDEYLYMVKGITEFDDKYKIWNRNVSDITTASYADKAEIGTDLAQKIRQTALEMRLPHPEFSGAGLFNPVTNPSDLVLFVSPEVQSNLDVSVLAYAFNMQKADPAEFAGRVITIDPIVASDGSKISAILADSQWCVAADLKVQNAQIVNPETLGYNSWLHRWEILSYSPFRNVVMFSSRADSTETIDLGTITGVTIDRSDAVALTTEIPRGSYVQLAADVAGSGNFSGEVTWAIAGQTGSNPPVLKSETYIDQAGTVFVAWDEANTGITVSATSMQDPTKVATASLVFGDPVIDLDADATGGQAA